MLRVLAATTLMMLCHQGLAASVANAVQASPSPEVIRAVKYDFRHSSTGGIERRRISKGLEVRGWKVGRNVYVGQTKIGDRWGAGVIVDKGALKYGINNRGLQIIRKF